MPFDSELKDRVNFLLRPDLEEAQQEKHLDIVYEVVESVFNRYRESMPTTDDNANATTLKAIISVLCDEAIADVKTWGDKQTRPEDQDLFRDTTAKLQEQKVKLLAAITVDMMVHFRETPTPKPPHD
jgi:hypothetical protein